MQLLHQLICCMSTPRALSGPSSSWRTNHFPSRHCMKQLISENGLQISASVSLYIHVCLLLLTWLAMELELGMLQERKRRLTRERVQRSRLGEDDYHRQQCWTTDRRLGNTSQIPDAIRDYLIKIHTKMILNTYLLFTFYSIFHGSYICIYSLIHRRTCTLTFHWSWFTRMHVNYISIQYSNLLFPSHKFTLASREALPAWHACMY